MTTYLPESVSEYYNAYTWVVGNSRNGIKVGYPITSMTALRYQRNKAGDILIDPSSGLPLISENSRSNELPPISTATFAITYSISLKKH